MILKFKKIRLSHIDTGLPTKVEELKDEIIVDFSLKTVKEIIKGELQCNIWPYSEITRTCYKEIYKLSVGSKGYCNDWNFKPTGFKKVIVFYYRHKEYLINSIIGGIVGGIVSNIIFYFLTSFLKYFIFI